MEAVNSLVGVAIIGVVGVAGWQYYICSKRIDSTEPLKIFECIMGTLANDASNAFDDAIDRYFGSGIKTGTTYIPAFFKGCEDVYDLDTLREMIAKTNPAALDSYDKLSDSDKWHFFAYIRDKCGKSASSMCTGDRRLIEFDANKKLWVSCSAVSLSRAAQKWMTLAFNGGQAHSFIITEDNKYIAQQDATNQLNGSYFDIAKDMPAPDSRFLPLFDPVRIDYDPVKKLYTSHDVYFTFGASTFLDSCRKQGLKYQLSPDDNTIVAAKGSIKREYSLVNDAEINMSPRFANESAFVNACVAARGHYWLDGKSDEYVVCDLVDKQLKFDTRDSTTQIIYK